MTHVRTSTILSCCLLALVACGKKVAQTTTSTGITPILDLPPTITLTAAVSDGVRDNGVHVLRRDGDTVLPATFVAGEGSAIGMTAKIFINRHDGGWEFHCAYKGTTNTVYTLQGCYDIDNRDLGLTHANIDLFPFPVDTGKKLELSLASSNTRSTRTTASLTLTVDWK
jgi:hypothetical protein